MGSGAPVPVPVHTASPGSTPGLQSRRHSPCTTGGLRAPQLWLCFLEPRETPWAPLPTASPSLSSGAPDRPSSPFPWLCQREARLPSPRCPPPPGAPPWALQWQPPSKPCWREGSAGRVRPLVPSPPSGLWPGSNRETWAHGSSRTWAVSSGRPEQGQAWGCFAGALRGPVPETDLAQETVVLGPGHGHPPTTVRCVFEPGLPSQCPGPASLSWAPGSSSPCLPPTPLATPGPQPPTLKGAMVARPRARSCFLRAACSPEEPPGSQLARSCTPQGRLSPREVLEGIRWPNGPGGSWQRRELGSGPGRPLCPRLCSALSAAFSLLPAEGPAAGGRGGGPEGRGPHPALTSRWMYRAPRGAGSPPPPTLVPDSLHACFRVWQRLHPSQGSQEPGQALGAPSLCLQGTRNPPWGPAPSEEVGMKVSPPSLESTSPQDTLPVWAVPAMPTGQRPSRAFSTGAPLSQARRVCWGAQGSVPGSGARPPPCALGQHRPPL